MEGVPQHFEHPADRAEYRRPAQRAGVEVYRAHIVRHAFEPHAHDGFGLGVIEQGVERFRYRGTDHLAAPGTLVLMNPEVLHTGRAETADGWRYRMAYVDAALVEAVSGERGWRFDAPVARVPAERAAQVATALAALWRSREPLAVDGALQALLATLRPLARVETTVREADVGAARFAPVIEHMRAHLDQPLRLEALAALAGLSPFHFQRSFKARWHATPQQMLMALRLAAAKRRLAAGEPAAQVAAAVGLADQAHLTRAFARRYGTTPARYQRQVAAA